jgi:integrase
VREILLFALATRLPITDGEELSEFLKSLEEEGLSPTTVEAYRDTCRKLSTAHPGKSLSDLTYEDIEEFIDSFPEIRRGSRAVAIRRWFKWAVKTGVREDDPARLLPRYSWPRFGKTSEIFTNGEVEALEALPDPEGVLMTILFEAGLTRSEASFLTPQDFDLENLRLHITKGARRGKSRVIPLDPLVAHRVAHFVRAHDIRRDEHLWATRPGGGRLQRSRPIGTGSFFNWWRSSLDAAGVTYRPSRQVRHTFAMRLRDRGLSLDEIQMILGHNSYYTTEQFYADLRLEHVESRFRATLPAEIDGDVAPYQWRVRYSKNPDNSYTLILLDVTGTFLKSARGNDFHDALLEVWKDVYPPSDEIPRKP